MNTINSFWISEKLNHIFNFCSFYCLQIFRVLNWTTLKMKFFKHYSSLFIKLLLVLVFRIIFYHCLFSVNHKIRSTQWLTIWQWLSKVIVVVHSYNNYNFFSFVVRSFVIMLLKIAKKNNILAVFIYWNMHRKHYEHKVFF